MRLQPFLVTMLALVFGGSAAVGINSMRNQDRGQLVIPFAATVTLGLFALLVGVRVFNQP